MHFHHRLAVFQSVSGALAPVGQLALFAHRHKTEPELVGDGGAEKKPARINAHDLFRARGSGGLDKAIDRELEERRVREHRGDVFKEDAGFGKIGHIPDAGTKPLKIGVGRHGGSVVTKARLNDKRGGFAAKSVDAGLFPQRLPKPDCADISPGPPRMERLLLVISTFCFLFGFAYTMHALGARAYRPSRLNFFAILTGFLCQTAFLHLRGQQVGRCPLTSFFEVMIFLTWALVLFYLLIGPAYRLSLLGVFTSPLAFTLQVLALLLLTDTPVRANVPPNPWMELHAAISIVAYGAFALASVAGVMYLTQERQLKTHHIHSIFYHLPPIRDLAVANGRLIIAGFALLAIGIGAGFMVGNWQSHASKVVWSVGVWVLYGVIFALSKGHRLSPRRVAWASVGAFSVALVTLSGISFITEQGQP